MAEVSNSCLTIDLTDDDPESSGVEIIAGESNITVPMPVPILNPIPGPSTSYQNGSITNDFDFEWESDEYLKLLLKMQEDFNKEFEEIDNVVEVPYETPVIELLSDEDLVCSTPNKTEAGSSRTDSNNNPGSSVQSPVKTDFPVFQMVETTPKSHRFINSVFVPTKKNFLVSINKDRALLQNDLPPGIYVKMFEDRLDLISALIEGPPDTPYEGCLFIFDIQLHMEHPDKPPNVHYMSFSQQKLNPNLYTTGMVCLSLLGTWTGTSVERWTAKSTIYQLLISIQGLILVSEPYYNEPAYHYAKKSNRHLEQSKQYNARTLALVLESMVRQIKNPPENFKEHILSFYRSTGMKTYQRINSYFENQGNAAKKSKIVPAFPLLLGYASIQQNLNKLLSVLQKIN